MLDRISQIVLIVFGLLVLVLLVIGLSVSCRGQDAGGLTPTLPFVTPVSPSPALPTPFISATPTPLGGLLGPATATSTPIAAASPTPGGGLSPIATATTGPGAGGGVSGLTPGMTVQHRVVQGEWLLQIARCYGAAYSAVHAANRLPNPDYILPGAIITVPSIGSQGQIFGPPCVQRYTVLAGDTWEALAARFGTTTAILRRANPGALTPGRQIWAPRMK